MARCYGARLAGTQRGPGCLTAEPSDPLAISHFWSASRRGPRFVGAIAAAEAPLPRVADSRARGESPR